jgi:hypothetical protein
MAAADLKRDGYAKKEPGPRCGDRDRADDRRDRGRAGPDEAQNVRRATKSGAFDKLSLGNQKVAFALYQAQSFGVAATIANGSTPASKPLTLEQIAAKRRSGQAWGPIFREMKALGLVHEKTLGQVVARYHQTFDAPSSAVASDN